MYVITGNDDVFALNAKTGEHPLGVLVRHRPEDLDRLLRLGQPRPALWARAAVLRPARRQRRGPGHEDGQGGVEDAASRSGRTATPSPARRSTTTASSTAASLVASLACAGRLTALDAKTGADPVAVVYAARAWRARQ